MPRSRAETLHAAAFVIDGDQQRRISHRMDLLDKRAQLRRGEVVAREQDHAADQRMRQYFPVGGCQLGSGNVDHQRSQGHGVFAQACGHCR